MKLGRLMSLRDGMGYGSGSPRHYAVENMPPGQQAEIQDRAPSHMEAKWAYRRTVNGVVGDWTGAFGAADEALEALKATIRAEFDQIIDSE